MIKSQVAHVESAYLVLIWYCFETTHLIFTDFVKAVVTTWLLNSSPHVLHWQGPDIRLPACFINSLSPGKCVCDFGSVNFKHDLGIDILSIKINITLEWMPEHLIYDMSTLVRVMAWCYQAISLNKSIIPLCTPSGRWTQQGIQCSRTHTFFKHIEKIKQCFSYKADMLRLCPHSVSCLLTHTCTT